MKNIRYILTVAVAVLSLGFFASANADVLQGRDNGSVVIRSAVFDGTVADNQKAAFDAGVQKLKAMVTKYPKIIDVRVRYMSDEVTPEKDAPHPYVTFDFYFPSVKAMDDALATSLRTETRDIIRNEMSMFKGKIYHFVRVEQGVEIKGK